MIKVIHVLHFSQSIKDKEYKPLMYKNFHHMTALQLKKFSDKYEVECWRPERTLTIPKEKFVDCIKHRLFPSSFSLTYGKEISFHMIESLKNENCPIILHIHEPHSWHGLLLPLLFSKFPCVGQHHGAIGPLKYLSHKKRAILALPLLLIENIIESFALKKYDMIYSLNLREADYLKKFVNKAKIRNQTMGVNLRIFDYANKSKSRKKIGIQDNEFVFLFVGRLVEGKGVQYLISAFKEFHKRNIKIRLIVIGDGPYKEHLQRLNEDYPIDMVGWVDHDTELKYYLAAADCYVHPSKSEGASVSIMEAMYMGLPIIATPAGNAGEIIKSGKTGILVRHDNVDDTVEAMREIYNHPNKHNKESTKTAKELFDWQNIAKRTINDYDRLVKKYWG